MDLLGRQPERGHGGNPNGPEVNLEYLKFAEFWIVNPPSFRGTFNPDKAEDWIKAMEKVFSVLACTDYQRMVFATYMLEADAEFWWNGVRRLLEDSQEEITWDVFKEAFYHKYFLAFVWNAKELEFLQLQQESQSVSEYIAKFEELCKFFTIYQRNPNEVWKCVKFEGRLREDILAAVGPMEIRAFATLANKSRLVEEYNKKLADTRLDVCGKRPAPEDQEFQHIPPSKKQFQPNGNEGKQSQRSPMK